MALRVDPIRLPSERIVDRPLVESNGQPWTAICLGATTWHVVRQNLGADQPGLTFAMNGLQVMVLDEADAMALAEWLNA